MTTPTEKLAALSLRLREHDDTRLYREADVLMSEAADAIDALLRSQQPATVKESLTVQQPGQDESEAFEAWYLPKNALQAIYAKHELATANLVISDLERIAADILAAARLSAPQAAGVPDGWRLVPIEPTREMWAAVNKLDDEMAAGGYDGRGCSIEQAWNCFLDTAPPTPQAAAIGKERP